MSYIIAVAGKGGTGKTTLCGLMIRYLLANGKSPVLAVDADANANLHEVLGLEIAESVGALREKAMAEGHKITQICFTILPPIKKLLIADDKEEYWPISQFIQECKQAGIELK